MPDDTTAQSVDQFRAEMRGLFTNMSHDISAMARDMGQLKTAVVGEPTLGTTGLVTRMSDVERDKTTLEKEMQLIRDAIRDERSRIDKKLAWLSGVGSLASIIFAIVLALIEGGHFFSAH